MFFGIGKNPTTELLVIAPASLPQIPSPVMDILKIAFGEMDRVSAIQPVFRKPLDTVMSQE